ncbi:alpha/beta hydrolase [Sedimentitalea xiamensis]|nr:alpha/beta fold hydrolase [Sedimentitalea xiamensis]
MMRSLPGLAAICVVLTAACAPRGELALVDTPPEGAREVTLLTATNRRLSPGGMPKNSQSDSLAYHEIEILLPPERRVGEARLGAPGKVDPSRHVTALGFNSLEDTRGFERKLREELRTNGGASREVLVFVHGYNTNFSEAAARFAQMTRDMQIPAVPVLFSWPSQARPLGYVHDRDSILLSREPLRNLLTRLRAAGAQRILLAAHSMGGQLVMETLLQADLAHPGSAARLADSVVLISPDISIEVFMSQVAQISRLPKPLVVFTSAEDQALRLSTLVAGNSARLGKPSDDPRLKNTGVVFLDVTDFSDRSQDSLGHLTLGTSPAMIAMVPQLRNVALDLSSGASSNPGVLAETFLTLRSVAGSALTAPQ